MSIKASRVMVLKVLTIFIFYNFCTTPLFSVGDLPDCPRSKFVDYKLVFSLLEEYSPDEVFYQPSPDNLKLLESGDCRYAKWRLINYFDKTGAIE